MEARHGPSRERSEPKGQGRRVTGWFADGLLVPAIALAALGWVVPRLLARIWPEGVLALLALAFAAAVAMTGVAMGFFLLLYLWQGVPLADLAAAGWGPLLRQLARLGLISALLWAPLLLLSVMGLPRRWRTRTW
nr:hypothetical protein [Rubellimicrobium sp. CFH 75288]